MLLPRFRLVTPSTVYSCCALRVPLMLNPPVMLVTVEAALAVTPPAITPGMVRIRSTTLRPLSAMSRSCRLVTHVGALAGFGLDLQLARFGLTVTVSVTLPTSSTMSPTLTLERREG